MSHLASSDEFPERFQRLVDGHAVFRLDMRIAKVSEEIRRSLGPVQLVEIDIIRLQSLQACVDGREDVRTIELVLTSAQVIDLEHTRRTRDLGRQYDLRAFSALLEPGAENALGGSLGFGRRRDRIHLGGIEKIDALIQRVVDLTMAFGLSVLFTEGHRPETDDADLEIGATKLTIFQGSSDTSDAPSRADSLSASQSQKNDATYRIVIDCESLT